MPAGLALVLSITLLVLVVFAVSSKRSSTRTWLTVEAANTVVASILWTLKTIVMVLPTFKFAPSIVKPLGTELEVLVVVVVPTESLLVELVTVIGCKVLPFAVASFNPAGKISTILIFLASDA